MYLKLRPPDGVVREQGCKAVGVILRRSIRMEAPSRTPGAEMQPDTGRNRNGPTQSSEDFQVLGRFFLPPTLTAFRQRVG